jgi:hypothetical protein
LENLADQYRIRAKEHFEKANSLLDSYDGASMARYAALELRLSIECVCYGLLYSFRNELSKSGFAKWQPKQVLNELLKIDERVTTAQKMSFQDPATEEWHDLGDWDHRFTAVWAGKAHNALGNALHVPTINQLENGKPINTDVVVERCRKYLPEMKKVLESKSWHLHLVGPRWKMNCDCGFEIHRRTEHITLGIEIICGECGRTYDVEEADDKYIRVQLRKLRWDCEHCGAQNGTLEIELAQNVMTECLNCKEPTQFRRVWNAFQRVQDTSNDQLID